MAVSYHYARQFIGRSVCAHCVDGRKYYGFVREVTLHGVWMDVPEGGSLAAGKLEKAKVTTADHPEPVKGETVQFFFNPFFIPFFSLLALSPFFFSPFFFRRRFFI